MSSLDWITTDYYKSSVGWKAGDTTIDAQLPDLITQASSTLNKHLGRQVTPNDAGPTSRTFQVRGTYVDLRPFDLRAATSVVLNPEDSAPLTLVANQDYALWVDESSNSDGVYLALRLSEWISLTSTHMMNFGFAQLRVTGSWGFATVPDALMRACVVTVRAWLRVITSAAPYYDDTGRSLSPTPMSVGEAPYAAQNIAHAWKRDPA